MNIENLKMGDVLLFSAEKGSFISWAITFLTDAPVSHAAMYYDLNAKTIVEETPPQVRIAKADERFKGRKIYVKRFENNENLPLLPVIKVANEYLNNNEPYDKSGLYLVGALLIYKKFAPNNLAQKIIIKILKKVTKSIVKYIHQHQNPGKEPMVCSQFVAQCYDNAGKKYKLQFKDAILGKARLTKDEDVSLLDIALEAVQLNEKSFNNLLSLTSLLEEDDSEETAEELCKQLKKAISTKEEKALEPSNELIETVTQFAQANQLLKSNKPSLQDAKINSASALLALKNDEDMFVAPGDLLNHCTNLTEIGVIK